MGIADGLNQREPLIGNGLDVIRGQNETVTGASNDWGRPRPRQVGHRRDGSWNSV